MLKSRLEVTSQGWRRIENYALSVCIRVNPWLNTALFPSLLDTTVLQSGAGFSVQPGRRFQPALLLAGLKSRAG
jgi:hypothetical protein